MRKRPNQICVLTSGGDAPGMNAAIRAVVRSAISRGMSVHGAMKGYAGILDEQFVPLNESSVANTIQRGGTILKTDRCLPFLKKGVRRNAAEILRARHFDALIVIGGDGSFAGAHALQSETGFPVFGLPGTIDNDVYGTEDTIGFDTAQNTALEAIDKIRDTASAHERNFVIEVMGRNSGFLAVNVGIAGGAETVVVPEIPLSFSHICQSIERGIHRGKTSSIIVIAEGKKPGAAAALANRLTKRGLQARYCILGHIQRGGTPTAHDRMLASKLAGLAVSELYDGISGRFAGIQGGKEVTIPLSSIAGKKKKLPRELIELAERLAI